MTETVIPMIPDSHEPMRQLVTVLCQLCASCSRQVAGELQLRQGQLTGLANLARQVKNCLNQRRHLQIFLFRDISLYFWGPPMKYKCSRQTALKSK
jgi:hypothetical protein